MPRRTKRQLGASDPAEKRLQEIERGIVNEPREFALFVEDADGSVVLAKKGRKNMVSFTAEEIALARDRILTHNHPPSICMDSRNTPFPAGGSLSPKDIYFAAAANAREIRAVTKTMVNGEPRDVLYRMERPTKGWPTKFTIQFFLRNRMGHVKTQLQNEVRSKRVPLCDVAMATMDRVWQNLAPMLDMKYESRVLPKVDTPPPRVQVKRRR